MRRVTVEVHKTGKERLGTGELAWNPGSREDANHSAPYLVAVTLRDGTVAMHSFNDSHLWNPELRALMKKIEVVENEEFTMDYQRIPQAHRARVTVVTSTGKLLVGEAGGDEDDLSAQRSDAQIVEKFRGLTEDYLGTKRVRAILDCLWHLENVGNVAAIPSAFILD